MTSTPFLIIGHRAARAAMPENSLEGFAYVLSLGLRAFEFDVHITADGIPVVTHDPALNPALVRDAGGAWLTGTGPRICDLTLAELQRFDVGGLKPGSAYGERYPDQAFLNGVRIPTLRAVLDLIAGTRTGGPIKILIEVKSEAEDAVLSGAAHRCAEAVCAMLRTHPMRAHTAIQSFDWNVLAHVAETDPTLPRSYLTLDRRAGDAPDANFYEGSPWLVGPYDSDPVEMIRALGGAAWAPFHAQVDAKDIQRARAAGLETFVWTANARPDLHRMARIGVDGVITDTPARAQRVLSEVAP